MLCFPLLANKSLPAWLTNCFRCTGVLTNSPGVVYYNYYMCKIKMMKGVDNFFARWRCNLIYEEMMNANVFDCYNDNCDLIV